MNDPDAGRGADDRIPSLLFGAAPVCLDAQETWVAGIWSSSMPADRLRVFLELLTGELAFGVPYSRQLARVRQQAAVGRAFVLRAPFPIVVLDDQGCVVDWNPPSERMFGWQAANVLGRKVPIVLGLEAAQLSDYLKSAREQGIAQSIELKARRADGKPLTVAVGAFTVRRSDDDAAEVALLFTDISDKARGENNQRMQSELEQLIGRSKSAEQAAFPLLEVVARRLGALIAEFWCVEEAGWKQLAVWPRLDSDPGTSERTSVPAPLGNAVDVQEQLHNTMAPVYFRHVATSTFSHRTAAAESQVLMDAIAIPIQTHGELAGAMLLFGIDAESIDESLSGTLASIGRQIGELISREQMAGALCESESQQHQANKMQSLGLLAGGIAHDFNNLLTIVLGHSELAIDLMDESSAAHDLILEVRIAAERAASLTRQLLTFSRKDAIAAETIHINETIESASSLLDRLLDSSVHMTLELDPHVDHVRADPTQLQQVILNLVVNARDAMPDGGEIVIRSGNVERTAASLRSHPNCRPGPYAALSVTDTGCGMDEATMSRVFEPFFTTKGPQSGTGMGLATVYGIVSRCGGFIEAQSQRGIGTTFTVHLPKCTLALAPQQVDAMTCPAQVLDGDETILLVEDEDVVRDLVQRILQIRGYSVHAVADSKDALTFLNAQARHVDLLLTDVVLPGMNGAALVDQVRRQFPHIKTAFMSGFPKARAQPADSVPLAPLLVKPFTSHALAQHVRSALDLHPAPLAG